MLRPIGRVPSLQGHRQRRRLWPWILLGAVVALVVGEVADQVVASSTAAARRSVQSWVAAVAPIVDESDALGRSLAGLREGAVQTGRPKLDRLLEGLVSGTAQDQAGLAAISLSPPTPAVGAALSRCIDGRRAASAGLSRAIRLVTGGGASVTAASLAGLESAAGELRASDAAYRELRNLLSRRSGPLPRRSVWLSRPAFWTDGALARWAEALRSAPSLTGHGVLSLSAVTLDPRVLEIRGLPSTTTTPPAPPTTKAPTTTTSLGGTRSGQKRPPPASVPPATRPTSTTSTTLQLPPAGSVSVLQSTTKVTVSVVVADRGSLPVEGVVVRAVLVQRGRAGVVPVGTKVAVERRIGRLGAGNARYVVLAGLRAREGSSYELVVTATSVSSRPVVDRVALCDAGQSGSCG